MTHTTASIPWNAILDGNDKLAPLITELLLLLEPEGPGD